MFNIFNKKASDQNFVKGGKQKSGKELLAEYQALFNGQKTETSAPVARPIINKELSPATKRVVNDTQAELREWKAPKILKTNLIQDEGIVNFDTSKNSQLLIISILSAVLIIAIGFGGIYYWESKALNREAALNEEINKVNLSIAKLNKELATAEDLEKKINLAGTLLTKHIYWSNFFKLIEDNTLGNVGYVNGFSGDTKGEYRLSAVADSYATIAEQAKILKQDANIKEATVTNAAMAKKEISAAGNQVSFDIQLVIDPKIFFNQNIVKQ